MSPCNSLDLASRKLQIPSSWKENETKDTNKLRAWLLNLEIIYKSATCGKSDRKGPVWGRVGTFHWNAWAPVFHIAHGPLRTAVFLTLSNLVINNYNLSLSYARQWTFSDLFLIPTQWIYQREGWIIALGYIALRAGTRIPTQPHPLILPFTLSGRRKASTGTQMLSQANGRKRSPHLHNHHLMLIPLFSILWLWTSVLSPWIWRFPRFSL